MIAPLNRTARAGESQIQLADERCQLDHVELEAAVRRAANGFRSLDRSGPVAICARNALEITIAHLGAMYAGRHSVPINALLTETDIGAILQDCRAAAICVGPETAGTGSAAARAAGVGTVLGWRCAGDRVESWEAWTAAQPDSAPALDAPAADIVCYTSGTTGRPKAVVTRDTADVRTIADRVRWWQLRLRGELGRGDTPCLVVGPMHHHGPLTSSIEGTFGGGTHILERFDPEATLAAIERVGAGSVVLVPTHLSRLLALPDDVRARYDVSSLHFVGLTGSRCPPEIKRRIIDWWGPVIWEAYGGTESGVVCYIDSHDALAHPGSVGRCLPDFEPLVIGDDDEPVDAGIPGHLYFRDRTGRGIEYRNDPAKTAAAHRERGVFTLGDIGYVDDDGFVFITDRADDMIITGGVNVYPAEIEQVLAEHPGVFDAAVIAVPHPDLGQTPLALVEPAAAHAPPSSDELIAHCRARLAHYKCPVRVEFVDSVGRSAMGKLSRKSLRQPYWPAQPGVGRISQGE